MSLRPEVFKASFYTALSLITLLTSAAALALTGGAQTSAGAAQEKTAMRTLAAKVEVGDIVFIRVTAKPFREVAAATQTWTNHVGIVIATKEGQDGDPILGESTFPFSRTTTLSHFIGRSEQARVAIGRLKGGLSWAQQQQVAVAAQRRSGIFYDTGFNLYSHRQFCSRYVREVLGEATGVYLGEIESFATLLSQHDGSGLGFWKLWYFGHIPWQRETVTPASLLRSRKLQLVFDGMALKTE